MQLLLILLLAAVPGFGLGALASSDGGDRPPATDTPGPAGLDKSRRFEACFTSYDDPEADESGKVCRKIWPGETDPYGNENGIGDPSPTGLPVLEHDHGGDPPIGNLQGMDIPTMLLTAADSCLADDIDQIELVAVELTSKTVPDPDPVYEGQVADDVIATHYDTLLAEKLVFAANPLTGRALDTTVDQPVVDDPKTRKGGDLLVLVGCAKTPTSRADVAAWAKTSSGVGATTVLTLDAEDDELLTTFESKIATVAAQPEAQLAKVYAAAMPSTELVGRSG